MNPRLRRQLEAAGDVPQSLLDALEAAFRAGAADRTLLEESVRTLTALLQRAQIKEAGTAARKAARNERAAKAARRLARLLDKSGLAVLELDPDLTVRSANAAAERICGAAEGKNLLALLEPLDAKTIAERWRRKLSRGLPIARALACSAPDGDWGWGGGRGPALPDPAGTALRMAGLMSDVTRHRLLVERMAHDARHDALTALPNRTLFLDLLRHSFYRTRRHEDYRFAVLFIDIDRFKMVNDAFGHEAGDQLLV